MRRKLVTIPPLEPVSGLMSRMVDENVGAVIVVDRGKPVGIITEKDVLERAVTSNTNLHGIVAKDVMSSPLITINADRPIKDALELMQNHQIRRLAVTENEALVGLVTERRLLKTFLLQVMLRARVRWIFDDNTG
jgi:CBS domain-containing protein